ncbi:MAG: PTS transporter subunit EIIC, partial [Erysipelotrichaceae bacterium]|nr:PTS transporter subunit EIIC [Erysipelotrichaceae bacterium]
MNLTELAAQIIEKSGGKENITNVTHCVTRLRLVLKDESKADKDAVSSLDGVISALFSSGQFQVVIGPNVDNVYKEVIKMTGSQNSSAEPEKKKDRSVKGIAKEALDTLIACFTPCLSLIAGCGMIKVLVVILTSTGLCAADSTAVSVLSVIGDSVFYYLPIFAAFNAARKLKTDPFLAMALGCILLHPNYIGLGEVGTSISFFGIPLLIGSYSAQALPAIFGVWILKYADKFAEKVSPNILKVFLRPMIALLITAPIVLIIVGPVSLWLSDLFMQLCIFMQSWGWLAVGVNALLFPIMVLTGTHNATIPLIVQMFATQGFDSTFLVSGMAANLGMAGAALGFALRARRKSEKAAASSASLSACLGITEPALYGVLLPNPTAFGCMMCGAFISGCLLGLAKLSAPAFMTPSFITAALFFQNGTNVTLGIIAVASCFVIPAVLTFLLTKPKKEDLNTLKVVYWIGGNDMRLASEILNKHKVTENPIINKSIQDIGKQVEKLADNGVSFMVIPNVPDIAYTPKFFRQFAENTTLNGKTLFREKKWYRPSGISEESFNQLLDEPNLSTNIKHEEIIKAAIKKLLEMQKGDSSDDNVKKWFQKYQEERDKLSSLGKHFN